MKRKERFLAALHHEAVDRVPMFDFLFQKPLYEAVLGEPPASYNGRDATRCSLALDLDAVWLQFSSYTGYQPEYLDSQTYKDEWGTLYRKTGVSWPIDACIGYPIKSRDDLKEYEPPDPTLPGRASNIEMARDMDNQDIALLGAVRGPMTTLWLLLGYEGFCFALYDDPGVITTLCAISNEYFKEAARLSVAAGCAAIFISEDLGDSTRGFLQPRQFKEYILPSIAELAQCIADLGVPALLHSDGNISAYLDDLAQTEISAIHPLQRTAGMDLREVKQSYGDQLCIIGNIDSSRTLPFGTPDEVGAEVRDAIDIAAPGGGYILASDHSIHDGIPIENVTTMFEVGAAYGRQIYHQ